MDSFFAAEVLAERGAKSVTSFDRVANEDCAESVVGDILDQDALEAAMRGATFGRPPSVSGFSLGGFTFVTYLSYFWRKKTALKHRREKCIFNRQNTSDSLMGE